MDDFFTKLRTLGDEYNIANRIQKQLIFLMGRQIVMRNKERHLQNNLKTTSPTSWALKQVASDSKEARYDNKSVSSSRPSGPFSTRANNLKLSDEVP